MQRPKNIDQFGKMPVPGDFILYPGPHTSIRIYEVRLVEEDYIKAIQYHWSAWRVDPADRLTISSREVKLTGMNSAVIIPREILPF